LNILDSTVLGVEILEAAGVCAFTLLDEPVFDFGESGFLSEDEVDEIFASLTFDVDPVSLRFDLDLAGLILVVLDVSRGFERFEGR